MKTARELLNELPEDIRAIAIANTKEPYKDEPYNSMLSFIYDKFVKEGDPEPTKLYWKYVANGFYDTAREAAERDGLFKEEVVPEVFKVDETNVHFYPHAEFNEPKPEPKKDKTILEWFQELPVHIRDKAIKNTSQDDSVVIPRSLRDAILGGFDWQKSPEGLDYWNNISHGNYPKEEVIAEKEFNFMGSNKVIEQGEGLLSKIVTQTQWKREFSEKDIVNSLEGSKESYHKGMDKDIKEPVTEKVFSEGIVIKEQCNSLQEEFYKIGFQAGVEHQVGLQKQKEDEECKRFEEAMKNARATRIVLDSPTQEIPTGDKRENIASIEALCTVLLIPNLGFETLKSTNTKLKQLIEKL